MKFGVVAAGTVGLLGVSGLALAQTPPARTGFQMDIRTGYSVPMGNFQEGLKLSDVTSGQVPFIVDIGGKLIPQLFLGGYLGFGFGGAGGLSKTTCNANNVDCNTVAVHIGVEAQYHILPGGPVNPWVGYGLGYESLGLGSGRNGTTTTASYGGFQFARFMAGVDFRLSRVFGVGPFADLSMATYDSGSNGNHIQRTSTHQWLTLGARFVFFP